MTLRIEYIGAVFDGSGYAEAARNYICALRRTGVTVCVRPQSFEPAHPDLGEQGAFLQSLISEDPCDLRIVHLTPENFEHVLKDQPKLFTVGYVAWETDLYPPHWVEAINQHLDALWVPSSANVAAAQKSKITVPVEMVWHCFPDEPPVDGHLLEPDGYFRFLSVFQWTERKNPMGLLKAYLTEFRPDEKVSLVLKSYIREGNLNDKDEIKGVIRGVKDMLHMGPKWPRIELIVKSLSRLELRRLYQDCDAFVSLHRCEGFGIPTAEAILAGKPTISTDAGGPHDEWGRECISRLVPGDETPVFGMPWPHYTGHMNWVEPDLGGAKRAMRKLTLVPIRSDEAKKLKAQFLELCSYERIGAQMVGLLEGYLR